MELLVLEEKGSERDELMEELQTGITELRTKISSDKLEVTNKLKRKD